MAGSIGNESLSSSAASQYDVAPPHGAGTGTSKQTRSRFKSAASKLKHKLGIRSHKASSHLQPAATPATSTTSPLADIQEVPNTTPAETAPGPEHAAPAPAHPEAECQASNLDHTSTSQWLYDRDIFVQVLHANNLRAADVNGSSDPVCKVKLGPFKARTRVLKKTLEPDWNETFIFVLEPDSLALMGGAPMLTFEIWDHNVLARDYFLGEAMCEVPSEVQQSKVTRQLPLHSNLHKAKSDSTGSLDFAIWLGPTIAALGRMDGGRSRRGRTQLSTLVRPFGQTKALPLVVHTAGFTVYEEPCLAIIHMHVTKVKGLQGSSEVLPQGSAVSRVSTLRRSDSSSKLLSPRSNSKLARVLHRSQHSTPAAMQRRGPFAPAEADEVQETMQAAPSESNAGAAEGDSPRSTDSPTGGAKNSSPFRQWLQGQEPWWATGEGGNGEAAPAHDMGESEADADASSYTGSYFSDGVHHTASGPGHFHYFVVTMGSQKHTSSLKHADADGTFTYDLKCPFVMQVPVKNRIVKMELYRTSSHTKSGKLLARACIPMFQLMGFTKESEANAPSRGQAEEGRWFRLHSQGKAASAFDSGIVKVAVAVMDADVRRVMYDQPLLSQDKFQGNVAQYEKQALKAEESGLAEPSLVELTPLPDHLAPTPPQSSQEGVMNWLHDSSGDAPPPQSHGRLDQEGAAVSDTALSTPQPKSSPQLHPSPLSQNGSSAYRRWPSFSSPGYIPQQHQSQPSDSLLQCTLAHARAAAAAGQEYLQELKARVQGWQQPDDNQPVMRPGENVPAGMLKLTLHNVELTTPGLCFCVLKVGPHWGRTSTLMASPKAAWDWEVHVPLYDPSSVLQLVVCSAQPKVHKARLVTRAVRSMLTQEEGVLGKLRIRVSTLQPWTQVEARLPLLADRDKRGVKVAHAHLSLKVLHWNQRVLLKRYLQPNFPDSIYKYNLDNSHTFMQHLYPQGIRIIGSWLGHVDPPISQTIAFAVVDTQRWNFTMARARTNWQRLQNIRAHVAKYQAGYEKLQSWEHPPASLAAIACTTLLSFYPHNVLACLLVYVMIHSLFLYRKEYRGEPLEMEADTEAEEAEEEMELISGNTSAVASLRRKYNKLQGVALTLQNLLDDVATQLERLHACITWQDPSATLLFIGFCACAAMALTLLGLPVVMATGFFWMLRPPQLRTPTPAPPVAFFKRLPSKSDQLI